PLPEKPPTLQEMIKLVAQLGGYVAHSKNSKPPGVETIWKGMQRTKDRAWETFSPKKNRQKYVWYNKGNALRNKYKTMK
ncbi:MAG: hypothetical protein LBF88_10715, partial [Planctomycetaceae bacterium]|nr:hypothetical protein [Planctomycetaceae bacterium]